MNDLAHYPITDLIAELKRRPGLAFLIAHCDLTEPIQQRWQVDSNGSLVLLCGLGSIINRYIDRIEDQTFNAPPQNGSMDQNDCA